jgi:RNA polymerase sigma factor (sigma-70 family)
MYSNHLKLFDEFYVKEYKYLKSFARSINPSADYESLLHDCYIKCRDRIEVVGYQGSDYMNFVRVTIMNQYKSNYRLQKKRIFIDIENPDFYNNIEQTLLQQEHFQEQQKDTDQLNSYFNTMIYEYVQERYSPKEIFIFKTYYLLKHKHLNYKTLSTVTGFSMTSVSNTIKRMKKDLKENLMSYIYSGQTNGCTTI